MKKQYTKGQKYQKVTKNKKKSSWIENCKLV